jgi:polygalacturonase
MDRHVKSLPVALMLCGLVAIGFAAGAQAADVVSVRDFGAKGDGKADDTDAFRKALAAAQDVPTGRSVVVPPGSYRITSSLTIESCLLVGLAAGGWPADSRPLPTIVVDVPAPQPCIIAKTGASLHGLCFDFDYAGDPKREFGPCVQLSGGGVSLTNLLMHNPTEGIMWDGSTNIGRLNLENIFMVNAHRCGVYVADTYDVATIRNVEVWNYVPDLVNTCTGFRLGHNDEIRLSDCAVVQAAIGFHFIETKVGDAKPGSTWGGMDNCTVDFSAVGIKVDAATILRISGGSIWAHQYGVIVDGRANVTITGADLRANGVNALQVTDCDSLTVNGCLFKKNGTEWPTTAKVEIDGGRSVVIDGCSFDETSAGIHIGAGAGRFSITGNVFADMPYPAITDESAAGAAKVIANNLGAK